MRTWWQHVILSTRGSWLPGDPRGWRSRGHRLHSSGDCKRRPPVEEHRGLHVHTQRRAMDAVVIPREIQPRIGKALGAAAESLGCNVLIVSVAGMHAHLLLRLPDDAAAMRRMIALLKQKSSHAVRDALPGRLWAAGGKPVRVLDRQHQLRVFRYIQAHAAQGAWVWTFRDG